MKKYIRKHIKDEKRILKLMYKKGLLFYVEFNRLGWEFAIKGKRSKRKTKFGYKSTDYLPELHAFSRSWEGEWDSTGIVSSYWDMLYWENVDYIEELDDYGPTGCDIKTNKQLITHLKELPTLITNRKINQYLRINRT